MAKTINQFQRESRMDCYAENEQLRAELAAATNKLEMAEAVIAGDGALITGLKNDLAAAQADALRYRWLRNNLHNTEALDGLYKHAGDTPTPEEFDAAINKEM